VIFTTGRGTPAGHAIAPVLKVGSNTAMLRRMGEHIDLDAGVILAGRASIEQMGARLFEALLAAAGGRLTQAELLGHREFAIGIIGPRQ
jgi:altronate dehydratase large subunit